MNGPALSPGTVPVGPLLPRHRNPATRIRGAVPRPGRPRPAAAMPVIAATQRPSVDIIPKSVRDLFSYRAAFRCTSTGSSNIILGAGWSEAGFDATTISPVNPGAILQSQDVACRRLKRQLAGLIVARRRCASSGVCLRWLPLWLPELPLALLISSPVTRGRPEVEAAGQVQSGWPGPHLWRLRPGPRGRQASHGGQA
jgi:hypothetical protein